MYPKLKFDDDSFDVIANEFSNYGALFHQQRLFIYDRINFKSKKSKICRCLERIQHLKNKL